MSNYFFNLIFLFLADRFLKTLFILKPSVAERFGGFVDLSTNENIAFSLPISYFILYPLIFLILFFLIKQWLIAFKAKSILLWPWGLIIIGAISNLLDRFYYGGVIDFISLPYFTVFNISDVYISVGVIWIIWYNWFHKKTWQNFSLVLRY